LNECCQFCKSLTRNNQLQKLFKLTINLIDIIMLKNIEEYFSSTDGVSVREMFVLLIFAPALYIPFKCSSYNCRNHFPFQPTGYSFIKRDVEVVAVSSKIKLYPKQRRGPRWVPKVKMNEVRNGGNQYQYSQFPPTTQPQ
jgi:hypothetical protein